jgi:hypothetical protein
MDQRVIDHAVKLATRAAMGGRPVERVQWLPPQTASADPLGTFVVTPCRPLTGSMVPPWEQ